MSAAKCPLTRWRFVLSATSVTVLGLSATLATTHSRNTNMQAIIRTGDQVITLVNMFTVEPANLSTLLAVLRDGTDMFFSRMSGFISSSVLVGKDGRKVINYSQWKGADEIAAFRKDARFSPYIQKLLALAQAETIECDAAYVKSV